MTALAGVPTDAAGGTALTSSAMESGVEVNVEHVTKIFGRGDRPALDGVSLHVPSGEIHGVLGRSGAGKSTLLRCLNALERPTSGTVRVDGKDVAAMRGADLRALRRRIGIVFQQFNLLDSRDVLGNIALPLEVAGVPSARRRERVVELVELVGLTERAHAHPSRLSGGQKQRVGIARALAARPGVLLCDEATSALDTDTTGQILDLVRDVRDHLGVTVVLITHELEVIRRICDSATMLDAGRVVDQGRVADLVGRPDSRIGEALLPLGSHPGPSVLVTLGGARTGTPVLSELARRLDVDVTLLDGGVKHLGAQRLTRMRLGWAGRSREVPAEQVVEELRRLGATAVIA